MLRAYLEELEAHLSRRLPADEIPPRIAEVAAHLDEAVEAFGEMGFGPEAAVLAMGRADRLARGMAAAALARWDALRLRFSAVALVGFGANLAGISLLGMPWLTKVVAVVSVASTFGVAYTAYRSRRPATPRVVLTGLALIVPMSLAMGMLWYWLPSPTGWYRSPRAISRWTRERVSKEPNSAYLTGLIDRQMEERLEERLARSAVRNLSASAREAAYLTYVVGGVDAIFGALGFVVIAAGRRRRGYV